MPDAQVTPPSASASPRTTDVLAGGLQSKKNPYPQLIEDGLPPDVHLERALALDHPYMMVHPSTKAVKVALELSSMPAVDVVRARLHAKSALDVLAKTTACENSWLTMCTHANVQLVLGAFGQKNLAFMREVAYVRGTTDDEAAIWLSLGLPMLGWAPPARGLMDRVRTPEVSIDDFLVDRVVRNEDLIAQVKSSGDDSLDRVSFQKSLDEVASGVMAGPFDSLSDVQVVCPCLAITQGIWELHGDAAEPSVRNIDDLVTGKQNTTSGTLSAHRPTDADALVGQVRATTEAVPAEKLMVWKSDYSQAFKQVPGDPLQLHLIVLAQFCLVRRRVVFFLVYSQIFGGRSPPLNFTRYPAWKCECMCMIHGAPMSHCVDDVISVEQASTIDSGRDAWLHFAGLCGWRISLEKSPPPSDCMGVIGIILDLRPLPAECAVLRISRSRIESVDMILLAILTCTKLGSGQASSLSGKLGFSITAAFGKVGRSKIRPILRRAYSTRWDLTLQLVSCLLWWRRFLKLYRPRSVPSSLGTLPLIVSYSDGEGSNAGVGVAVWCPWLERPVAAYTMVPREIRNMWASLRGKDSYHYIYRVEAVGPLLALTSFPKLMRNALWLHFIDNTGAEASLVSGSSSIDAADHIVGLTWEIVAQR